MDKRASGLAKMAAAVAPMAVPGQSERAGASPLVPIPGRYEPGGRPFTPDSEVQWRADREVNRTDDQTSKEWPQPVIQSTYTPPIAYHLSRRQAWQNALPSKGTTWQSAQRADQILDASQTYREARPELYKGLYRETDPDYPIPVVTRQRREGVTGPISWGKYYGAGEPIADALIKLPEGDVPPNVALHETVHASNVSDAERQAAWGSKDGVPFPGLQKTVFDPVYSRGKAHPDRTFPLEGPTRGVEFRAELENRGIDTNDPEAIQSALMYLQKHPEIAVSERLSDLRTALQRLPPMDRKLRIKELSNVLPGFSSTDQKVVDMGKRASGLMKMAAYTESTTPW